MKIYDFMGEIFLPILVMSTLAGALCWLVYTALWGPSSPQAFHRYRLQSGLEIECAYWLSIDCGLFFSNCKDGQTYQCQTNAIPLGDK